MDAVYSIEPNTVFNLGSLDIVIVNYNVKYFLEQALRSVEAAATGLDVRTWVVDNASVDDSVKMVKEHFPKVHLLANTENLGFSKANNQAILKGNADYVLLLNPDTVLAEDTLRKVIHFMDQNPQAGGLGVRMIDGKGKFLPESKRGLPTPLVAFYKMTGLAALFPKSKTFGKYHLKYLSEFETHEVEVLSGAFMLLRRSVLNEIGLLDEMFFMYGEDIDLSYRITQAGFKNYYFPDTTIIHYKGESTKKKSANYVKVFYQAMVLFAEKHYKKNAANWFSAFIKLAIWLRASLALSVRLMERISLFLADFLAIYLGYYAIIRYWEYNHKYVRGFYPDEYWYVHVPIYILWVQCVAFLSGGYDPKPSLKRLVRGTAAGALLVFAGYAFLPKSLQFSRAILLIGSIWAVIAPFLIRVFLHWFKPGKFHWLGHADQRILIVAAEEEAARIRSLLNRNMLSHKLLGTVAPAPENQQDTDLGHLNQLRDIIDIYKAGVVIFSAADNHSQKMMEVMSAFSNEPIAFKIAPPNSLYIIGSDSKNAPGELYTMDLGFSIADTHTRRKKRIFDLAVGIAAIAAFPLLIVSKGGRTLLAALPQVLLGSRTWVSYAGQPGSEQLPKMKKGIFLPAEAYPEVDGQLRVNISVAYARDYHIEKDWLAVWKSVTS